MVRSWFLGSGPGQQLFSFRSPAVHCMARTSSLNCLSCRNPYQAPHSLNASPIFTEKPFVFTEKCFVATPKNRLLLGLRWDLILAGLSHSVKSVPHYLFPGLWSVKVPKGAQQSLSYYPSWLRNPAPLKPLKAPWRIIKKGLLQKSEGNFSERSPGWILPWIFFLWGSFWGAFFCLAKKEEKKSTQKSTAKFKSEFGSFAAKIYPARIGPWRIKSYLNVTEKRLSGSPSKLTQK